MRLHTVLLLMLLSALAVADATPKCDRSLIRGVDDYDIDFNTTTKVLTCVNGEKSLMAIEFNSKLYEQLSCSETEGWIYTEETYPCFIREGCFEDKRTVVNARYPLKIACVEYCAVHSKGEGVEISIVKMKGEELNYKRVECKKNYSLKDMADYNYLYFGKNLNTALNFLTCDFKFGWPRADAGIDTPMQFECRTDPPTTTSEPTMPTTQEATTNSTSTTSTTFTTTSAVNSIVTYATRISSLSTDGNWLYWLWGGVGVVIVIGLVILLVWCVAYRQEPENTRKTKRKARKSEIENEGKNEDGSDSVSSAV